MIAIRLGVGGILRFRMVDSGGAAVTGLVDGDFVSRRYVTETDTWGDLSGTITEGEAGWYSIPVSDSEADAQGQAVAYFSDGTNEAHATFMIDGVYVTLGSLENSIDNQTATINSIYGTIVHPPFGGFAASSGSEAFTVSGTPTSTTFDLAGPPASTDVAEESLVGCFVRRYKDDAGSPVPLGRGYVVVAYDTGTGQVTVSPAMDTPLAADEQVIFFRPVGTLLDHPDGVEPGVSQRIAQRRLLAEAVGESQESGGTVTVRDVNNTRDAFTADVDASGNRSNFTFDDGV